MLTIVRTRWHDETDDGIMLVDFDETKVTDEDEATKAIESILYELAKGTDGDPCAGDLVGLMDDDALAKYGARLVDDSFMVVSVEGYARPLATYAAPPMAKAKINLPTKGTDENGLSLAIEFHVLPHDDMVAAGFRIPYKGANHYSLCRTVERETTFNVSVPTDGSRGRIDILDEMFCQPYDYQSILMDHPDHPFANRVKARVDDEMEALVKAGVLSGWSRDDYI